MTGPTTTGRAPARPGPLPLLLPLLLLAAGCGGGATEADTAAPPPLSAEEQKTHRDLESKLSAIVNDETVRYTPLQYDYNEGLLDSLDRVEPYLSGRGEGEAPRLMPKLDADEELAHLRETNRRWEAKRGKTLREEVDALKADVAARKPGEAFHPEFQKRFSGVFDDFIAIEVAELRERRNRAIHARADELLAPHRASSPEAVRRIEQVLDAPPYDLPDAGGTEAEREKPGA